MTLFVTFLIEQYRREVEYCGKYYLHHCNNESPVDDKFTEGSRALVRVASVNKEKSKVERERGLEIEVWEC
jgi:hypothetical protein